MTSKQSRTHVASMERAPFRCEIEHPTQQGTTLVYGSENGGVFLEVHRNGVCSFICFVETHGKRSVAREVVRWTIDQGFFTVGDIDDAIAALDTRAVQQLSPRLRSLAMLVLRFRPEFFDASSNVR